MSKPVDATGHTDLETLLARALWQNCFLLASIYVELGKREIPIYNEVQRRMKAIPTDEQAWLNSNAITDGQS